MKISRQQRIWRFAIPVIVLACVLVPAAAFADSLPGDGATTDPLLNEGVVYTLATLGLAGPVRAGDVVICESGVVCNASTPTSQWSDVLVFYNATNGAYIADTTLDTNTAQIFSGDDGSLGAFLSQYNGLSSNATFWSENPTGLTLVGTGGFYQVNSPEVTPVPEPGSGSLLLLGSGGLFGLALKLRRKLTA